MRKLFCAGRSRLSDAACPLQYKAKPAQNTLLSNTVTVATPTQHHIPNDVLPGLNGLPHEVLLLILSFLCTRTILVLKTVSRHLRGLIENDKLLTYQLELAINGMSDGPLSAGLTIRERLDKLRQYSERYCAGQFQPDVEMALGRVGFGEMTHLMTPRDQRSPLPDSFGGSITFETATENGRSLVVYAPTSIIESTSARCWTIPLPLPGNKRILAVDVTQGLVVALAPVPGNSGKGEMFLLSLESGGSAAHALAETPTMEVDWRMARLSVKVVAFQIFGPYLAWKMPCGGDALGDYLEVRDWKTGNTLWGIHMDSIPSYTFIDTSYLAMVFNSPEDRRSGVHKRCPDTIKIYRIREEGGLPVGHIATLQLAREVEESTIITSSAPSPLTPPPSAAFWPDPEQRVVLLRLWVPDQSPPHTFMGSLQLGHRHALNPASATGHEALLIIPRATFCKHVLPATTGHSRTPNAPVLWEDWGLSGSVLVRVSPSRQRQPPTGKFHFSFGSRLTFLSPSSGSDGSPPHFVTVDTNPLAKLHAAHLECTQRDALGSIETDDPDVPPSLRTTHPRSYHIGPAFSDAQRAAAMAITQNASGFAVITPEGVRVFAIPQ